ncbi:metallophosphoesterase family protein [Candidatus Riflebacteria bacterium]
MVNTIGIIGDVHAEDGFLAKAIQFFKQEKCELLLCTGDIPDGPGDVDRCCKLLKTNDVITVAGNHERWFLNNEMRSLPDATMIENASEDSKDFLRQLPKTVDIETAFGKLLLCQGMGKNDMSTIHAGDFGYGLDSNLELKELQKEGKYNFILSGHSHQKMVRKIGDLILINAGTLYRNHDGGFLILDFAKALVRFFKIFDGVNIREITHQKLPI